jgi:hypothetical protein
MEKQVPPKGWSYLSATQRHCRRLYPNTIRILKSHNCQLIMTVHEWKDYGYILNEMTTEKAGIWASAWRGSQKPEKSLWVRFKPRTSWLKVCHVTTWDKLLCTKLKKMYPKNICLLFKKRYIKVTLKQVTTSYELTVHSGNQHKYWILCHSMKFSQTPNYILYF